MNTTTALLALCCIAAMPLLALEPQAVAPAPTAPAPAALRGAPDKQEWERRFLDRINNQLIWNTERSIAVGCINIGASHQHSVYWCFRENADGSMEPFACYSIRSNTDRPAQVSISADARIIIQALPADSQSTHYTRLETAPLYREILELNQE